MKKSLTIIMAALVIASLSTNLFAQPPANHSQVIGALDWEERGGIAEVVAGPWKKCGEVIAPDQPFEYEDNHLINPFPIKAPCEEGAPWFYRIFSTKERYTNLAMMEGQEKYLLSRDGSGEFTLEGLTEDLMPAGPEVFKLGANHYRMYFWAHSKEGETYKLRLMVAESSDLHHWEMANNCKSLLCHPADSDWGDGLSPSRICNDATTIYHRPDGTWEIFSSAVTNIKDQKSRYADKKLCPGYVRIVMRWTSPDGLNFSSPEVVLTPDSQDSPATQCYYLSMVDLEPYTVGFFGNFNIQTQRVLMEPVWSRDHRHWSRPMRNQALFEEDYVLATSITDIVAEPDGNLTLYYTGENFDHNGIVVDGGKMEAKLYKAQVPRRKFFGRKLESGVALVSPIIRYTGKTPKIYVSEDTELTCEWQELFATTTQSVKVQRNGDIAEIMLSEIINPTATGRLHITGNGIVYDAEY